MKLFIMLDLLPTLPILGVPNMSMCLAVTLPKSIARYCLVKDMHVAAHPFCPH